MNPIHIEFEYTPQEFAEAMKAALRRRRPAWRVRLSLLAWAVLLVVVIGLFNLTYAPARPRAVGGPTPADSVSWRDIWPLLLSWFLIFGFLWFFFRQLRRVSKDDQLLHNKYQATASEAGLIWLALHADRASMGRLSRLR